MCVKFPPKDFKPDPCPPHPTNTYTYGVTIILKMYGSLTKFNKIWLIECQGEKFFPLSLR